jgi:hypothetical protein
MSQSTTTSPSTSTNGTGFGSKRTPCPVSRQDFAAHATKLVVTIREHGSSDTIAELVLDPKEFSTGSLGYYASEKVDIPIHGRLVKTQAGITLTLVNSKDLPKS